MLGSTVKVPFCFTMPMNILLAIHLIEQLIPTRCICGYMAVLFCKVCKTKPLFQSVWLKGLFSLIRVVKKMSSQDVR